MGAEGLLRGAVKTLNMKGMTPIGCFAKSHKGKVVNLFDT